VIRPQIGDVVQATFKPSWDNKGGTPYTIVDRVWRRTLPPFEVMVGDRVLVGALNVDIVEAAA
jgi:hypothetical protein